MYKKRKNYIKIFSSHLSNSLFLWKINIGRCLNWGVENGLKESKWGLIFFYQIVPENQ